MISPRWRKVLRDLWHNKTRTLLVVLSIAVGVFAIGAVAGTQAILPRELTAAYLAVNPAHAAMFVDPFDDDLVQTVRSMRSIVAAEGRRVVSVKLQVGPDQWKTLQLVAIPDYNKMETNLVRSQSGAWPPPKKGVLIERSGLSLTRAKVGGTITVETPDGKRKQLEVAGLAHDLNQPPIMFTGIPVGYVTFETIEWLGFPRNYDQLNIIVAGNPTGKDAIRAVANEVQTKVEKAGKTVYFTWIPTPGKHPADEAMQPLLLILAAMGSFSLVLSGFLVVNTISAILTQHVRQIGIMKAIGARTGQIMGMYFSMVLAYGILALIVAIPLGAVGAWGFTRFIAGLINFDISTFAIPPGVLAIQAIIGLVVPVAAAFFPIIAGAWVSVREAISDTGIGQVVRKGWLDRVLERVRGLSRPLLLSLRNTFRRKGRLALTLFTLTLGGAMFVGVFSVRDSLFLTMEEVFRYQKIDVWVSFSRPHRVELLTQEVMKVPGVAAAEGWAYGTVRRVRSNGSESDNIQVNAPPIPTDLLVPEMKAGRWLLPGDENAVVVNTDLLTAEKDDEPIQVGDVLTLKMNGKETEWRVVGIMQGALAGPRIYVNYDYWTRLWNNAGRAGSLRVVTEQHDTATQQQVVKAIKDHFESIGMKVDGTYLANDEREMIGNQFNILVAFLLVMAVLMAVVGGLGLAGTMSINVLERTREIGVMRAVGAGNGAVLKVFMVEGVLIGLLSGAIASVLALPFSRILSDIVGIAFLQQPLSYTFSVSGLIIWLIIVILVSAAASFVPAWNAARLRVREVLAYQ